jgi:hypothetical protein
VTRTRDRTRRMGGGGGAVGSFERSIFRFVNGLPDGWRPVFHEFQLLGVLGAPLVVAAVAPSSDVP